VGENYMRLIIINVLEIYIYLFIAIVVISLFAMSDFLGMNSIMFVIMFLLLVPLIFGMIIIQIDNNSLLRDIRDGFNKNNLKLGAGSSSSDLLNKNGKRNKYKDGKKDGEWLFYYDNGQLKYKSNWKDGKPEGEYLTYHENGQLKFKRNYKDGKEEGKQLWYYETGQLAVEGNSKNGKEEGKSFTYSEKGQLEKTQIFKDGKLIKTITP